MEDYKVFQLDYNMLQISKIEEVQSSYIGQVQTLYIGIGSRKLYGVRPYEKEKRNCRNNERNWEARHPYTIWGLYEKGPYKLKAHHLYNKSIWNLEAHHLPHKGLYVVQNTSRTRSEDLGSKWFRTTDPYKGEIQKIHIDKLYVGKVRGWTKGIRLNPYKRRHEGKKRSRHHCTYKRHSIHQ